MRRPWFGGGLRRLAHGRPSDQGFAAVDALVALTLLSMTIGLSLAGAQTARKAASKAQEVRQAQSLLQSLIETAPSAIGERQGRAGPLNWRYTEAPLAADGPAAPLHLCEQSAQAVSLQGGRRYEVATITPCPVDPAQ